jgi:hypothetical protein
LAFLNELPALAVGVELAEVVLALVLLDTADALLGADGVATEFVFHLAVVSADVEIHDAVLYHLFLLRHAVLQPFGNLFGTLLCHLYLWLLLMDLFVALERSAALVFGIAVVSFLRMFSIE